MVKFLDWFEIDLPDFMDNQYGEFAILLGIWMLIGVIALLVVRPMVHAIFARTKTRVDERILEIVGPPIILLIFLYGFVQSLSVLDAVPGWLHRTILDVYTLLVSLVVVYLAYKVFRTVFIPLGTEYAERRKTPVDRTVLGAVDLLGGAVIVLLGLFWVLGRMGIDVTVFLAGLGIAGLVLAFALQDTLSNFFSGLHLMLDRPFAVGDTLEINGEFMEVLKVGFRSTRLYNVFAHDIVIMPNNMIANQMLVNVTKPDLEYRVAIEVGVAYGSPVTKVKEILLEAVKAQPDVVIDEGDKRPRVNFVDFGESALQFKVRFFVKDVLEQWSVMTAVREHIDRRFKEEGIVIPFPQRTLSFLGQKEGEELRVASGTPSAVGPATPTTA